MIFRCNTRRYEPCRGLTGPTYSYIITSHPSVRSRMISLWPTTIVKRPMTKSSLFWHISAYLSAAERAVLPPKGSIASLTEILYRLERFSADTKKGRPEERPFSELSVSRVTDPKTLTVHASFAEDVRRQCGLNDLRNLHDHHQLDHHGIRPRCHRRCAERAHDYREPSTLRFD